MAMPPRVMVLSVAPTADSANTAVTSESGMATIVIRLARMLARKMTTTRSTSSTPSRRAAETLCTARSMKSA